MLVLNCERCERVFKAYPSAKRRFCSSSCAGKVGPKTHGESRSRLYNIWSHMKTRCSCETASNYQYYGGRGITVCDEWVKSFEVFRNWAISHGYAKHLELDRANGNVGYSPENCRWATKPQQAQNTRKRRDAKTSKFKGVSRCNGKFRVQITKDGSTHHVGMFENEVEAAGVYDREAVNHFGPFAHVNFPVH